MLYSFKYKKKNFMFKFLMFLDKHGLILTEAHFPFLLWLHLPFSGQLTIKRGRRPEGYFEPKNLWLFLMILSEYKTLLPKCQLEFIYEYIFYINFNWMKSNWMFFFLLRISFIWKYVRNFEFDYDIFFF